jgi:muconolactone delta-isomerase
MAMPSVHAMRAWLAEHRASGKIVDTWSFAGMAGGGGVLEVESHEELDAIMMGFPYGQVSTLEVYALADLDAMLDTQEATIARMMKMMGG